MQLDQTQLVMRPRSLSEVGDLTLAMLRSHPRLILTWFVVGAALWVVLDALLLAWIPLREWQLGLTDDEATVELLRYVLWVAILILVQTPIAGSLLTVGLGRVIFEEEMGLREMIGEWWSQRRSLIEMFLLRGLVLPLMVLLLIRIGSPFSFLWDVFFPLLVLVVQFFTRGMNPFVPEILLLEKCPLRISRKDLEKTRAVSFSARSSHLHRSLAGGNSGRFIIQGVVNLVLAASIFMTLMSLRGVLLLRWDFLDLFVLLVLFPVSLWLVAGISVVVRLLLYLDTRLRLEGWDVELLVRAEVLRQFGSTHNPTQKSVGELKSSATDYRSNDRDSLSIPTATVSGKSVPQDSVGLTAASRADGGV